MGRRRKLTDAEIEVARKRRQAGESLEALAEEFGCNASTVWRNTDLEGYGPPSRINHQERETINLLGLVQLISAWKPTKAPTELDILIPLPRWIVEKLTSELLDQMGDGLPPELLDPGVVHKLLTEPFFRGAAEEIKD